jgi:uncharacterized cupin superfamily protein
MTQRPSCLHHWQDIESAAESVHPITNDPRVFSANFGAASGLTRLGVRHERLMPGRRTSPPHAERDEEELVFVIEGTPDLWQDGVLYRLAPGLLVGWPAGTGIAHTLINNSDAPVRLLTVGEASRYNSRIAFPLDPQVQAGFARHGKDWTDPPIRTLGPHDGLPDAARAAHTPEAAYGKVLPPNVVDWRTLKPETGNTYSGDDEVLADFVPLLPALGFGRIGGGIDIVPPGRRTSYPHAERDEDEFAFVVAGNPTLWLDGHLHAMQAGDCAAWPNATGEAHTILNDSNEVAILFTLGEASRARSKVHYPLNPKTNAARGERWWSGAPARTLGPHDGRPRSRA